MFIAYVKQKGEGCDYTIACGETLWRLKAKTYEDAIKELKDKVVGEMEIPDHGDKLANITLFEISSETQIPVDTWYADTLKHAEDIKAEMKEEAERSELHRLEKKYGHVIVEDFQKIKE